MKSVENYRVLDIFYVARQPIFKNSGEIWGYELLYRSGSNQQAAEISNEDIATLCVATCGFVLSQEYTDKTKKICINFTEKLILEGAPRGLPPSRTVVDILENVRPTAEVMKILEQLRKEGYTIAIDGFEGNGDRNKLLDIADIVKIDIHGKTMNEIENAFLILKTNKALKMAKKVDNRETLRPLRRMGCDLYQGNFFAKPINLRGRTLKPAEISKLRILQALEDPSLTPEKINEVIATDPSLTYRLLRY